MAEYLVRFGESMIDVCYNSTGSMQAIDAIMDDNGIDSYTHEFTPGKTITVPDEVYNSKAVQVANERPFNSACQVESSEIDAMIASVLNEMDPGPGYYIYIDGLDQNYIVNTDANTYFGYIPFETNGTLKILSYVQEENYISINIIDNDVEIILVDNFTQEDVVSVVTLGIEEDPTVTRTITIIQSGEYTR